MSLEVIAIGSDNLVRLDNLTNASSGGVINNAVVNFILKDQTGAVLQASTVMGFISNGRYEGTLTATTSGGLSVNGLYTIEITATASGTTLFRRLSCIAKYRSAL